MPITITALGTTLQVSILDGNFKEVQDYFRSRMVRADISGQFTRYNVLRYTGGRIVSATSFANPYMVEDNVGAAHLDLIYRSGTVSEPQNIYEDADDWSGMAMEMLGRPGPSMYYQWQEDGLDETAVLAGVAGWPPNYWPINRYPAHLCFSPWLTIPGAAIKSWVDSPCVARIHAMAKGALNFFQSGRGYWWPGFVGGEQVTNLSSNRFSIVVDTNPNLYSDEFQNTNLNIKTPGTTNTAPYVSWKVIQEAAFYCTQRQMFHLAGEVALKGSRHYNFSMKYRDGNIRGCVMESGGVDTWFPGRYGTRLGYTQTPTPSVNLALYLIAYNDWFRPPLVNLWESSAIHVEFFYNRSTAYQSDTLNSEFKTKPV